MLYTSILYSSVGLVWAGLAVWVRTHLFFARRIISAFKTSSPQHIQSIELTADEFTFL